MSCVINIVNSVSKMINRQYKWFGVNNRISANDSIIMYRMAFKIADKREYEYDSYLPDPDYDDCCIRVRVNEISLIQRLRFQKDIYYFCRDLHISVHDLFMMPIQRKMPFVRERYDIIALLQLSDYPEPIPISEINLKGERPLMSYYW